MRLSIYPEPKLSLCDNGEINDEKHFLLRCNALDSIRIPMIKNVLSLCPNFRELIPDQKIIYLLNAGGDIIRAVGTVQMVLMRSQLDLQ